MGAGLPHDDPPILKVTGGLCYELIGVPEYADELGEGFQKYVGEVVE